MKKRIAATFAAALVLSMTACGGQEAGAGTAAETAEMQETEAQETEAQETEEAPETAAEEESGGNGAGGPGQGGPGQGGGNHGGPGGGGGFNDKSSDTELQAMIEEVAPEFELKTFEDEETGESLQYQLYVPEDYDPQGSYPLLQFIPDSSVVGKGTDAVLTQGWGGLIFASEKEQEKHPSFIVIPVFTETVVNDNAEHSGQIDIAVRLIEHLTEEYPVDTDRIYTTGQSMGGMTSFYMNISYPDLFAASLFVGSQWDNSQLGILEDRDFFYIVSAGDPRASEGQAGLLEVFEADGAPYSHAEWSARDDAAAQDAAVAAMLEEGNRANFVTFTEGSTLPEGTEANSMMGEHMSSFDYAYRIEAVRDWLYEQKK